MEKVLMILEVSRKQDYIFGSHKLKENASRSADIAYVTSSEFFESAADGFYNEQHNFIYAGGGHTVLQFDTQKAAVAFAARVTEEAMRRFRGLEIFVKTMAYMPEKTPGENLKQLSKELERKKSRREHSFCQSTLGVEQLDSESYLPVEAEIEGNRRKDNTLKNGGRDEKAAQSIIPPASWEFPKKFEDLRFFSEKYPDADDTFIAVIHIDGNSMGSRVDGIYQKETESWEKCCERLKEFSKAIQDQFEEAFHEMVKEITGQKIKHSILPLRPVILAGDDVCFVTAGCIGLECARIFMEKLSEKQNPVDEKYYAACAGIALVHNKYPFHLAYNLAEELCNNAKRVGAAIDEEGRISAMDWHIEFGQMKDSLGEIRKDYKTEDGNYLQLRPVVVRNASGFEVDKVREYAFFKSMCLALQEGQGSLARSKMKEWRTALKQGEKETGFFLQDKQIKEILYHPFGAMYRIEKERAEKYMEILQNGEKARKEPFQKCRGEEKKHCIFFDSIEMMDHAVFFEEVER